MSFTELIKEVKALRLLHDKPVFLLSKELQPLLLRGDNSGLSPVTQRPPGPAPTAPQRNPALAGNEWFVFLGREPSVEFWSSWERIMALARLGAEFGYLGVGRKGGHKGRARQYTSPEEIDAQLQAEKQKAREEEEQEEGGEGATGDPKKEKKSLDSDESDEDDEDYQQKRKGVEGLIDIENPNRVIQTTKKVTQLDLDGPKELSRREREEIEKQKAKERYMKMHLAGKTEQAKADLARLAIIRKQREEAARKKEEERKG
ncbi:hypothetical protein DUI87_05288 [Hirundo rustica rustica]|uniref:Casein kinase substrate phosphoprotein PP28 domain-containing protein n=1 Tax=Hirundo rustica rustica TaxID=333673 RepID=A0A3M0L1F9_HIRRU|nr:hypothetical protein DUI87_05288 [Hirundo rustica rustica]